MRIITLASVLQALVLPALASPCGDRVAALDRRLDAATTSSTAASSSGQGVAAAREGQAAQPGASPTVPFQDAGREADATRQVAESGGGGAAAEARAALNRARTAESRSDEAGCMRESDEVERLLARPN
ncbi:hypothetical protein ACFQX4_20845 [Roseomonas sp. GCM10028921]